LESFKRARFVAALRAGPDDKRRAIPYLSGHERPRIRERCDIILNNSTGGRSSGDILLERTGKPADQFRGAPQKRCMKQEQDGDVRQHDDYQWIGLRLGRGDQITERRIKPEWEYSVHTTLRTSRGLSEEF